MKDIRGIHNGCYKVKKTNSSYKIIKRIHDSIFLFTIVGCVIMLFTTNTIEEMIVANAKLGAGFFGKIKIIGVEAYVGWGITIDYSQGIRVGAAIGACGEVYLEIDWVEFFEDLFNGRFWS